MLAAAARGDDSGGRFVAWTERTERERHASTPVCVGWWSCYCSCVRANMGRENREVLLMCAAAV